MPTNPVFQHRRLTVTALILALIVHGWPMFATGAGAAAPEEGSLEAALRVICSQGVALKISPDGEGENDTSSLADDCPLCPVNCGVSALPAPSVSIIHADISEVPAGPGAPPLAPTRITASQASPRAPPASLL